MADMVANEESREVLYSKGMTKLRASEMIVKYSYKIENYRKAAALFAEASGYEDADEKARECEALAIQAQKEEKEQLYERSVALESEALKDQLSWKKIVKAYKELGDYKDSQKRLEEASAKLKSLRRHGKIKHNVILTILAILVAGIVASGVTGFTKYAMSWAYMKAGLYNKAVEGFQNMPGFLNADRLGQQAEFNALSEAKLGDTVSFGTHEWKVVKLDKEDVVTLLAVNIKEEDIFYTGVYNISGGEIDWESSSMRKWLNETVLEEVFNDAEQEHLLKQTVETSENKKYETVYEGGQQDYITLPSAAEMLAYQRHAGSLKLDCWLRTPGHDSETVAYLSAGRGDVMYYGYPSDSAQLSVCPVIQIDRKTLKENAS